MITVTVGIVFAAVGAFNGVDLGKNTQGSITVGALPKYEMKVSDMFIWINQPASSGTITLRHTESGEMIVRSYRINSHSENIERVYKYILVDLKPGKWTITHQHSSGDADLEIGATFSGSHEGDRIGLGVLGFLSFILLIVGVKYLRTPGKSEIRPTPVTFSRYNVRSEEPREVQMPREEPGRVRCLFEMGMTMTASDWLRLGNDQFILKNYRTTIEYCENALEIASQTLSARYIMGVIWHTMGNSYASLENHPQAIECYKNALTIDPRDDHAWASMGNAYRNLLDYRKAIDAIEQALKIHPQNSEAWADLAIVYCNLLVYQRAIECHRKVVQYNPHLSRSILPRLQELKRNCIYIYFFAPKGPI